MHEYEMPPLKNPTHQQIRLCLRKGGTVLVERASDDTYDEYECWYSFIEVFPADEYEEDSKDTEFILQPKKK